MTPPRNNYAMTYRDITCCTELVLACLPDPVPGVRSESGYFRSLERRCGDGTEREINGGDHRLLA